MGLARAEVYRQDAAMQRQRIARQQEFWERGRDRRAPRLLVFASHRFARRNGTMGASLTILLLTDGQRLGLGLLAFAVVVVVLGVVIGLIGKALTKR